MLSSIGNTSMNAMYSQRPTGRPNPGDKFKEMDADGDGSLNIDELQGLADKIAEMSGNDVTGEDLLAKLDADGNGTLEMGELPRPGGKGGGFRGPPPFLSADGSVQSSAPQGTQDFNPLESLLEMFADSEDEQEANSGLDYLA